MASRIQATVFGLSNAVLAGSVVYLLATGEIAGWGWVVLASWGAFIAVVYAVRLALLHPEGGEER